MAKTAEQKKAEKVEKLVKDLNEAGVVLTGNETVEEIETLHKNTVAGAKPAKASKNSVSVQFHGGVRAFTKELHGEGFEELAKNFAKKHNGEIL